MRASHRMRPPNRRAARSAAALALAAWAAGCARDVRVGRVLGDGGVDALADAIVDAPAPDGGACVTACRPAREAAVFHHAVCLTAGWPGLTRLRTDGFDSRVGPYDPARPLAAGSAATDGDLGGGDLDVGGAVTVSGGAAAGALRARGRVRVGGSLAARSVEASALSVGGSVRVEGDLAVRGTFTSPFGADLVVGGARMAGAEVRASVAFPHACEDDVFDFAARAEPIRQRNDDAGLGLRVDALAAAGRPERVALPCGRYHFRGVSAGRALVLAVSGHVEVVLDDDVTPSDLRVELAPGADVDVIVAGAFRPTGAVHFGDAAAPARARLWVFGGPAATLAAGFAGLLYAPGLAVRVEGPVYGALRVNALQGAQVEVHYDVAAVDASGACAVGGCAACVDCPGRACGMGACGACADDDGCCAGLRCEAGRCVPGW
ncbi:MAG: hypothetical protein U0324_21940 [Polyangiales bacterium]